MMPSNRTAPAVPSPRPRDVVDLTEASGYPSISVLMPTEPGPRMTRGDSEQLEMLVREVGRQLRDQAVPASGRLMERLRELTTRAAGQPTDLGLAVYVNLAVSRAFHLPGPVRPRAVVEQTFATRDLVHSMHLTPPYALLVLHPGCAHLYETVGATFRPAGHRDLLSSGAMAGRDSAGEDAVGDFLDEVDRMLGAHRREHPSPLVLAGTAAVIDRFTAASRNLHRLAGCIPLEDTTAVGDLASSASRLLQDYLRSRAEEALGLFEEALDERPRDVATGVADCWEAVHRTLPHMLLVEEDFVSPVLPLASPAGEGGRRRVHDLIDDLIEVVVLRGGQLALVEHGRLARHGRVALVSRAGSGAWRGR